jgi:hypothetical protein
LILGDRLTAAVRPKAGSTVKIERRFLLAPKLLKQCQSVPQEEGRARMASYASNTVAGILIVGAALLAVVLVSGGLGSI